MFRRSIPPENDERMFKLEELLDLSYNDKLKFWKIFKKYKNSTSQLSVRQFYKFCGVEDLNNQFVDGIFRLCDCGSDQSLIFSEFVAAVTTYCMFEKAHMFKYCFFAFDTDGNGFIDKDEIQNLEKCLFHDGHKYTNTLKAWRKALNNADANKDGLLDFEEFNTMLTNNPMMTYPAWQMQTHMMHQILGKSWWENRRHKLAIRRKKAKKDQEKADAWAEKRRMLRLKHEHIHRIGYVRFYFAPIIQWASRKIRRMRNNKSNRNRASIPIGNDLTSPEKHEMTKKKKKKLSNPNQNNLSIKTKKKTKNSVDKFAREFSLSPQKQVIRSVYGNGVEKVLRDKDGGTPKVVKWSREIDEQEEMKHAELEKEIETDRSNGLHRSGHWNPHKLNKLNSYSKEYRKNHQNEDDIAVKEDDDEEDSSSSSSSSSDSEHEEKEEDDDERIEKDNQHYHHLAPPTGIYEYSNPNPITKVSSLDKQKEEEEKDMQASIMFQNINKQQQTYNYNNNNTSYERPETTHHLSPLRTLSTNNTFKQFSSPFQQKIQRQQKIKKQPQRHTNKGKLYNLPNNYNSYGSNKKISRYNAFGRSDSDRFEYTSEEENGNITFYNSGNVRQ